MGVMAKWRHFIKGVASHINTWIKSILMDKLELKKSLVGHGVILIGIILEFLLSGLI